MSNYITLSILAKEAVLILRKNCPQLKSSDREYNHETDHTIYVPWEVKTEHFSMAVEDYPKEFIKPAVDALCDKMLRDCTSPILLRPPKPDDSIKACTIIFDGLSLSASQGFSFTPKPIAYFCIHISYYCNGKC